MGSPIPQAMKKEDLLMNTQVKRIISIGLAIITVAMLFFSPIVPRAAALSYSGSASYKSGKYYTALTAVTLTGDQRTDIVNVAKSQVGYQEGGSSSQLSGTVKGSGNYTEYGRWYGMQDMWCAMFVSWCAHVAGVPTSIVTSHSYTPTGLNWFINKGQAYSRSKVANGSYTPQPGDIIYFKSDRNENITNHVGIVTGYSNGTVYTIEGNTSSATISTNGGAVCEKSYAISNTYIVYICSPSYTSGVISDAMKSVVFDAAYYANKYADLKETCGTDAAKLYDHFLTKGISEGRQASPVFHVKYYLENNSAVKEACGSDYMAAYEYFLETGYKNKAKTAEPANLGNSFYSKIQFASGKNLSLSGTNVIIYPDSEKPAQVWEFVRLSNGCYKIINTKNSLCLSVAGNSKTTGSNVELSLYTGAAGQKWYIYENTGKYVLRPYCSSYCVLDVAGASTADLTNVQIAVNDNAAGQLFTLTAIEGDSTERMTDIGQDVYCKLTNAASGGNLDVSVTNVISNTANFEASQVWRFIHQTDGSYKIINQNNGKVLEAAGGTDADGTNVQTGTDSNTTAQRWYVYRLGGHLTLRPACSETRRLEISDGNAQIKASSNRQQFTLTTVEYLSDVSPADLGADFYAKLTNAASGKNMSLSGTNVISYPASTAPAQVWRFVRQENGSYKLINQKNEMLLDLETAAADGTNVCISNASGAASQTWYLYVKEGQYLLRPASSENYVLAVAGGSTEDGANVRIEAVSYTDDQLFTIQKTEYNESSSTNSVGATDAQMTVIRKIIYAVETGGQVYGNVDYTDFTEAYTNSSEEHAITIGGGQWYANEAKKLLNLIRATDPATFASLDTAGITNDLDTANWSTYKLSASSAKAKCIVKIISSDVGIRCQDQLIDEQMVAYMAEAKSLGVDNMDALMMCANIRHQGGLSAVKRVLGKTSTPYTLDNIYAALKTDTGNQVGAYTSRQKFVYNTLKKYISGDSASNVKYLPACSESEESIVTALTSVGVANADAEYRMRLAIANGITDYAYTAEQNTKLLDLLKKGMLIDPEGTILTGWYTLTGGKRYYYDATGTRQYGWLTVDGKTYYLDPSTGVMTTGTREIDGVTYDFGTDGVLIVNEVCTHDAHNTEGVCLNCGKEVSHVYEAVVTAPSCTDQGYTTYTCTCGNSYQDNFADALGHSYVDGVCNICGAVNPDYVAPASITLASATLSFEDEILYNLYFTVSNMDASADDMGLIMWDQEPADVTVNGGGTILDGAVYDEVNDRYMVSSMGIPGQYMGDTKYLMVYAKQSDGSYVYSNVHPYSAKIYCTSRLEKSTNEKTKMLCVALMNYGAQSQLYFGHNTDTLMNAGLDSYQHLVEAYRTDMMNPKDTVSAAKAGDFGVTASGFTSRTATMSADGNFSLNYYFTTAYAADHVTFYCWTAQDYANAAVLTAENASFVKEMTPTGSQNQFWTDYRGIAAKEIDENVYVCGVYEVDGVTYSSGVIPYSIGYYCTRKAAASGDMQALAMATAVYCYYAKAYFGIS